jgi:CRISPR-associated protein Csb1
MVLAVAQPTKNSTARKNRRANPMQELTYDILRKAVDQGVAAVRSVSKLQPAGGVGDKIFPPTYVKEGQAPTKYAMETRRVDGAEVQTVLLDSVASQANRMEEALLEGWRRKSLEFPVVQVDFSGEQGLEDLEQLTALQAPHRIADAILRDSLLDGVPFRHTSIGQAFTEARVSHATAMYRYCPTALVFGVWDSTGPKGGLGAKFQRALVSEIVGINAVAGVKVASRIDPLGIEKKAGVVYKAKDPAEEWTLDEAKAEKAKGGKAVPFVRGGKKEGGSPAALNHGNIPPSIDAEAGGVTIDYALQTAVLSLPALRRLRFTESTADTPIEPAQRDEAELNARTVLAALALCALWTRGKTRAVSRGAMRTVQSFGWSSAMRVSGGSNEWTNRHA